MLDLLLYNARVITMDPARPTASAIGVWRDRIVGLDDDVNGMPARRQVDLGGAVVLPAFLDAHVHQVWAGMAATGATVAPCTDVHDVLAAVRVAAAARPVGEWVDLAGYDQRPLGRHLTAAELDTVSAGRKVFLVHDSGHACVVNTAVLELLPPDVPHDDGFLAESGMAAVRALRQPYSQTEMIDAIEHAGNVCLAQGITAVAEAGIGGGLISYSPAELAAYQRASDDGRLPVRTQLMVAGVATHPLGAHPADDIPAGLDLGLRTGFGGDRLNIGAMKIFTDGGMMARTAALSEPYTGLDHSGQLFDSVAAMEELVLAGHRAGWQLAVHAIGDRAVDVALDAIDRAQREKPRPEARHRIEHAGLVRPDQLSRFAELGVTAVVQPNFLYYLGDDYAVIMGERRAPWLYRGQGFLDAGVRLVASSDRPVTEGAPLRNIQFMVNRQTRHGHSLGPAEAMFVYDALRAYTVDAAWACHWEHDLGSVTAGKLADLVVLAEDPLAVPVDRIAGIPILATVLGGTEAHGSLD
ncbi:amidohydrolase [Pseudonocardiaceae bacterium YIM PH 21723]|nr:amidohydrolase [Pseudonocardiaceae bacterium YIM PH 21723]